MAMAWPSDAVRRLAATLLLVWLALTLAGAASARDARALRVETVEGPRVALVIGNADYHRAPLRNPVNDARALAVRLRAQGFEVIEKHDLEQRQIGATLREFRARLRPGATALFYYAGHGLQINGVNYLPAVDADIHGEEDVPTQSIDVNKVLEVMEGARTGVNLVFLDACRNNPYSRSFRSAARGLARVSAPSGTLIFYATRPGSVAADGDGDNGLYTRHLLEAMDQPGLTIEQVQKRVALGVERESAGKQEPWMEGLLKGEFYFRPAPEPAPPPPPQPAPVNLELAFWQAIQHSGEAEDFREYLNRYPKGTFAGLAERKLKSLAPAPKSTPTPTPTPATPAKAAASPSQPVPLPKPAIQAAPAPAPSPPPTPEPAPVQLAKAPATTPATTRPLAIAAPTPGDVWEYEVAELYGGRVVGGYRVEVVKAAPGYVGERIVVNQGARVLTREARPGAEPDLFMFRLPNDTNYWITDFSPWLDVGALEPGWNRRVALPLGDMGECSGQVELRGVETVATPAGEFAATRLRLVCDFRRQPQQSVRSRLTLDAWYAPEAGRVVRVDKRASASDGLGEERESYRLTRRQPR